VGDEVGLGGEDKVNEAGLSLEVGDEGFEGGEGVALFDGAEGVGPVLCAAVGEVVAVDGGDDGVAEVEESDGAGYSVGFVGV